MPCYKGDHVLSSVPFLPRFILVIADSSTNLESIFSRRISSFIAILEFDISIIELQIKIPFKVLS